jgi:hypothetical protein
MLDLLRKGGMRIVSLPWLWVSFEVVVVASIDGMILTTTLFVGSVVKLPPGMRDRALKCSD